MSAPGSAMCMLCGFAGTVETDMSKAFGPASAMAFAVHFTTAHPEVRGGPSRYIALVPLSADSSNGDDRG